LELGQKERKEAKMTSNGLRKEVRQRLYGFARHVARWVSDSRRQRFLQEMVVGLVISGHVHLTRIARSFGSGANNIHADEKRLSRHLDSEHWSMRPVMDGLLEWSAAMVGDDTLIVGDLTDVAKYYARHLEGLGRVRDGSDPEKRTAPGYMLFEAYVRVRRWQLFPLVIEPLQTYAGAPTSENEEILDTPASLFTDFRGAEIDSHFRPNPLDFLRIPRQLAVRNVS
jgi:hypothetical protein